MKLLLEIQIKVGLGKLELDFPVEQIPQLATRSGLTALALDNTAIFMLGKLPSVHRDPFDRLLACEAIQQGVPLASADAIFSPLSGENSVGLRTVPDVFTAC
jgi:PIN domain nuclease of toxin-antitoxin system